jgi:tetratricopeptide (TPR) repeat protein
MSRRRTTLAALALVLAALGALVSACSPGGASMSSAALAQAQDDARQGQRLMQQKHYADALALYQRAYPVMDAAAREGHAFDRESMVLDYVRLLDLNHRYADLLALSRTELEHERQRGGVDTQLEGYLIEAEAAALFGLGRRTDAIARYRDAMAFVERTLGAADGSLAWYWILIAEAKLDLGDAAGARVALAEAARRLDPPDFRSGPSMALVEQLTRLAVAIGKNDLALKLAQRAVAYGELVQREPEAQAVTVAELAQVHAARGEYARAVALHRRALPAMQDVLGEAHPLCTREMEWLASALAASGEWDEALRLMQHATELADQVLGPQHPDTLKRRQRLGEMKRKFSAARTSSAAPGRT